MQLDYIEQLVNENKQTALYAYSQKETINAEFAQVIYLCPTNLCNHRCITCGYPKMRKGRNDLGEQQRGIMPWSTFTHIVNQLPEQGRRLYLQKTGEPLIHPRIVDMMCYIKEHRPEYEIALHTNISLMKDHHVAGLIQYCDFISLSIFGFDRASYKKAHGKDGFHHVLKILEKFYAKYIESQRKPKVYFDVVRCSPNRHLADEEIFAFLSERFPAFNIGIHFPYNFQNVIIDGRMETESLMADINYPSCIMPYSMLNILWDGRIGYCVGDPYETTILGNACEQNLLDIWNNKCFQDFRSGHQNKKWSALEKQGFLCKKCNWLFALKSQSLENLCLVNKKNTPDPLNHFTNGVPVTSQDNLIAGLLYYRRGEIAEALKALSLAEISAQEPYIRNLATEWIKNAKDVLLMRKNVDLWEEALNKQSLSLSEVHVSKYYIGNAETQSMHSTVAEKNSNGIFPQTTKKTAL